MRFDEIRTEVLEIVRAQGGRFITAYQICQHLQQSDAYRPLWNQLIAAYPSTNPNIAMGEGTGYQYSPASFVANALKHYAEQDDLLAQAEFVCDGVSFSGIAPGYTGNVVGIWAARGA
jgi:hypothetical protein